MRVDDIATRTTMQSSAPSNDAFDACGDYPRRARVGLSSSGACTPEIAAWELQHRCGFNNPSGSHTW